VSAPLQVGGPSGGSRCSGEFALGDACEWTLRIGRCAKSLEIRRSRSACDMWNAWNGTAVYWWWPKCCQGMRKQLAVQVRWWAQFPCLDNLYNVKHILPKFVTILRFCFGYILFYGAMPVVLTIRNLPPESCDHLPLSCGHVMTQVLNFGLRTPSTSSAFRKMWSHWCGRKQHPALSTRWVWIPEIE